MPEPRPEITTQLEAGWARALEPVADELRQLEAWLVAEDAKGRAWLPEAQHVLRAFRQPFDAVRVLIVGQDPYPTPGHAIGLSFAVAPEVRLPRSLQNIYRELRDDLGIEPPTHGDLAAWSDQGVLLLNRVLTVRVGEAGSHRGIGWETVTEAAIRALLARRDSAGRQLPLVAILWGAEARALAGLFEGDRVAVIESPHPSPLSARRGFFGSRPFSRANDALEALGAEPVDWRLPSSASVTRPALFNL